MFGLSIVIVMGILGFSFCLFATRAIGRWRGWWRWAMAAPLLLMVGVVLNIVIAIWLDPTAHNLWPLEVLAWLALVSVVTGVVHLAHWFSQRALPS
jgi:hypothetical protein